MVQSRLHGPTSFAKPSFSGEQKDFGRYVTATARLTKLERMSDDPGFMAALVSDGRYLRLCAAIARASEAVEQARASVAPYR